MAEEKEELKTSEEDEKTTESEKDEEKKSEEEGSEEKDGFKKDDEVVPASKYNQVLRKQREAELEKRELEKQLAEAKSQKPPVKKEEEEEDDDFFKGDEEEEKKTTPDPNKIIDEKLKPVLDTLKKREESDKKLQRTAFFEAHPEYLSDAEKFQELLDEMDNSINPNSTDDYYTQLEKTHRILVGDTYNPEVDNKKRELATDAASGGDGAEKGGAKEEFTAEDKKYMKEFGVSEEGMRAYKKKIESGDMQILS